MTYQLRALLFMGLAGLFSAAASAKPKTIELEGPSETRAARFVQQIVEAAYGQLGYEVRYRSIPHARSFVEANEGRIDGLRARTGNLESRYPNLVRVPFPLYTFEVMLVADRRRCGACDISQLKRVATVRGFKAFDDYLLANPQPHLQVNRFTDNAQVLELLKAGRVDAALFPVFGGNSRLDELDIHFIKQTLTSSYGYHYVHKKHQALADKLAEQLRTFQQSGLLSDLRKQYGVEEPEEQPNSAIKQALAVSGDWTYFTDSDDATYWQILHQVYANDDIKVTHKVSNWRRAKLMFAKGNADMLVGAYAQEMQANVLRSEMHIGYEMPVTALARDEQTLSALLQGRQEGSVCYGLGYDFKRLLPDTLVPYEGDAFIDCLVMLEGKRVDMIADYIEHLPQHRVASYASQEIEAGQPLFVLFQDSPKGRNLRDIFDRELRQLVLSGKVESMFPNQLEFSRAKLHLDVRGGWPAKVATDLTGSRDNPGQ